MASKSFSVIFHEKINAFNKTVNIDSDKSISQRSFIIGSICEGTSTVKNILESHDIYSTINCLRKLNCKIKRIRKGEYKIFGKGLGSYYCNKNTVLNFGNSGTAARLLGFGVCSTNPNLQIKITGDKSLRNRSMYKIIKAMENFGVTFLPKNKLIDPFFMSRLRGLKKLYLQGTTFSRVTGTSSLISLAIDLMYFLISGVILA